MTQRRKQIPSLLIFLTITLVLTLLIGIAGCQTDHETGLTTTAITASTTSGGSETAATTTATSGEITFPFPAPDFAEAIFDRGQYRFLNTTAAELDNYLNQLVSAGFNLQRYAYRSYLQKENVFLEIADNTKGKGEISLVYYMGMSATRPGTLSPAQAQAIIGEEQLSVMEMPVPDLYEKTGAQLFYVVPRSQDENSNQLRKYLVRGSQAFLLETPDQAYQVFDIDRDGQAELLMIIAGRTSGLFTFGVEAVGLDHGTIMQKYKEYSRPVDFSPLLLRADNDSVYVYAAEYVGTVLQPTVARYRLEVSQGGGLAIIDIRS
jgi:hypothetical protein